MKQVTKFKLHQYNINLDYYKFILKGADGKMMYVVKGTYHGCSAAITWQDGKLIGPTADDLALVRRVKAEAEVLEGHSVGVIGQYTATNHLADPLSALIIIQSVMDSVDSIEGDVPQAEELPAGAIG